MKRQPIDFTRARGRLEHRAKLRERRAFDNEIKAAAWGLVTEIVSASLGTAANASRIFAVRRNLIEKLLEDSHLAAELAELQRLPVTEESRQQRLAALEQGVKHYLLEAIREQLPELGTVCITSAIAGEKAPSSTTPGIVTLDPDEVEEMPAGALPPDFDGWDK